MFYKVKNRFVLLLISFIPLTYKIATAAETGQARTIGDVSDVVTNLLFMSTGLLSVIFFMLGMGFVVGAIIRFRAHFKNPSAAPMLTPILMSFLAIIMFSFNAFNHWKQDEVFGTKKVPVYHLAVSHYQQKNETPNSANVTPLTALRLMQNGQQNRESGDVLTNAPPQAPNPSDPMNQTEVSEPDDVDEFDEEYTG